MSAPGDREPLDRRTYDLLRLIDANEPIGSIRLVELMQRRGYSIKGRTIRLTLSDLDEAGLTRKVPGKGRELTETGRTELDRGDVSGRLAQVRERIATLTSQVTYDPDEDAGDLVVSEAVVPPADADVVLSDLRALSDAGVGPVRVAVDRVDGGVRVRFPSSITLDGVLLAHGVQAELVTAGLVEYDPGSERVLRYVDAISGEGSTVDVVRLLVEAGRTATEPVLAGETGTVIVDNRTVPLTRLGEARDLSTAVMNGLGGVLDIRRPRESGPFPGRPPGWDFASLTYGGVGELALSLLAERGRLGGPDDRGSWDSLVGVAPREALSPVSIAAAELPERRE